MDNYVDLVDEDEGAPPQIQRRQTIISPRSSPKGVAVNEDKLISIYAKQKECTRSYKKQTRGKRKIPVVRRPRKRHKQNTYSLLNCIKTKSTYLKGNSSEMPINLDDDSDTDTAADVGDCEGALPAETADAGNPHNVATNASNHHKITADADDPQSLTADASNRHKTKADAGDVPADMNDATMHSHAIDRLDKIENIQDCHAVSAAVGDRKDVPANSGACNVPETNVTCPKKYAKYFLYAALARLRDNNDSNDDDVNAIFDSMCPEVIGDDVMVALIGETPAKRLCHRELAFSKNPLVARRSSELLEKWKLWTLNYQVESEEKSSATDDDDNQERSDEHYELPSKVAPELPTPAPAVRIESPTPAPTPAPAAAITPSQQLPTSTVANQHDNAQPNTAECVDLAMDNDSDNDSGMLSQSSFAHALTELKRTRDSKDEKVDFGTGTPTRRSRRLKARNQKSNWKLSEITSTESLQSSESRRFFASPAAQKVVFQYRATTSTHHGVASSTVTITEGDVYRLRDGEFLNDSVIAFYLSYLHKEILSERQRKDVYIFSPFYFKILCRDGARKVHQWVRDRNIFECAFLVVPIVEHCHWSLAIVCNPGRLLVDAEAQSSAEGASMKASGKSEQHIAEVTKDAGMTTDTGEGTDTERHKRVDCDLADTTPKTSEEEDSKKDNVDFEAVASAESKDDTSPGVIPVGGDADCLFFENDPWISRSSAAGVSESALVSADASQQNAFPGEAKDKGHEFHLSIFDPSNESTWGELVGRIISVHWASTNAGKTVNFYRTGRITKYNSISRRHTIKYHDDLESLEANLRKSAFRLPPHKALYDGESEPLGWTWEERYPPEIPENHQQTPRPLLSSTQSPPPTQLALSKSVSAQQSSTKSPIAKSPLREPATSSAVSSKTTASKSDQVTTEPQSTSGEVISLTDVSDEEKEASSETEDGSDQVPETQRPCVLVLDSLGCHDAQRTRERLASMLQVEAQLRQYKLIGNLCNKQGRKFLPLVIPKIPSQSNGYDCGVFLLKYLQSIVENMAKDSSTPFPDPKFRDFFKRESFKQFRKKDMLEMRGYIKAIMESIKNQNKDRDQKVC